MLQEKLQETDKPDTGSTVRIDRRNTIFAQIEAALLADKLSVLDVPEESTGSDPYNCGRNKSDVWGSRRR